MAPTGFYSQLVKADINSLLGFCSFITLSELFAHDQELKLEYGQWNFILFNSINGPDGIRTRDTWIKSPVLCQAELRSHY